MMQGHTETNANGLLNFLCDQSEVWYHAEFLTVVILIQNVR